MANLCLCCNLGQDPVSFPFVLSAPLPPLKSGLSPSSSLSHVYGVSKALHEAERGAWPGKGDGAMTLLSLNSPAWPLSQKLLPQVSLEGAPS